MKFRHKIRHNKKTRKVVGKRTTGKAHNFGKKEKEKGKQNPRKIWKKMEDNSSSDNGRAAAAATTVDVNPNLAGIKPNEDADHDDKLAVKGIVKSIFKNKNQTEGSKRKKVRFLFEVTDDDNGTEPNNPGDEQQRNNTGPKKMMQLNLFAEPTMEKPLYYVAPYTKKNGTQVKGFWKEYPMMKVTRKRKRIKSPKNNKDIRTFFGQN